MEASEPTLLPDELLTLEHIQPSNARELHGWCKACCEQLEGFKDDDEREFNFNELHRYAARLVRKLKNLASDLLSQQMNVRYKDMRAKCVADALFRFETCIEWCEQLAGVTGLSESQEQAYKAYEAARESLDDGEGGETTDDEAYYWVKRNLNGLSDYTLPSLETWKRYVRAGRKYYGTNKNSPRPGRICRSAISLDEANYGDL